MVIRWEEGGERGARSLSAVPGGGLEGGVMGRSAMLAMSWMLTLLLAVAGGCQSENLSVPKSVQLQQECEVVPLTRVRELYVAEGYVNGEGPYRFLLDTGASDVTLMPAVAKSLKLEKTGYRASYSTPSGRPVTSRYAEVGQLRLGQVRFNDLKAAVMPMPDLERLGIDGIIGFRLFWNCRWTLDGPGKRLIVEKSPAQGQQDLGDYTVLPMTMERGVPRVPLWVGWGEQSPQEVQAIVDSGFGGVLDLPHSLQDELGRPRDGAPATDVAVHMVHDTAAGKHKVDYGMVRTPVRVGDGTVTDLLVGYSRHNASIGVVLLSEYVTTFDRPNGVIRMRYGNAETPDAWPGSVVRGLNAPREPDAIPAGGAIKP